MADPGHEVPQAGCRSQSSLPGAENGRQVDVRATTALSCGSCGWRDRFAHVWKCKGDSPPILVPMQPQVALRQLCLQPELLTPGTTILSLQDPKLSHQGAEQEDSQAPLQMSFLGFVSHQPSLLGITRDSVAAALSYQYRSQQSASTSHPGCRCVSNTSPHSIFGPASTSSCSQHPLADDRSSPPRLLLLARS